MSMNASVFDERKEWLEARGRGLGGTDTSAVVGLNPWKRPIDVFLDKTGKSERRKPTEAMFWGTYLEHGVVQEYARQTGRSVVLPSAIAGYVQEWYPDLCAEVKDNQTLMYHPELSFVLGTPDGLILGQDRGLECKTAGFKSAEWGKPGTDEVPTHYRIQVAQYMAIHGFDVWDIAVLFSGNHLEVFTVGRDISLEDSLLNHAAEFWRSHVLTGIEPTLDASEGWKRHLAQTYAIGNQTFVDADEDICLAARALADAQQKIAAACEQEALAKNRLAQLIGENKGARLPNGGGKVQWIRSRPAQITDWETLARSLNPTEEQIASFTSPQQRAAYVRLYGGKEEQ